MLIPVPSIAPSSARTARPGYMLDLNLLFVTLCELGRVERLDQLGANGPLVASAGSDSLFHCLFGRDSIRMASDLLTEFPRVAERTLIDLARLQGVRFNPRAEEEPGRILHEHRHPEDPQAARLSEHWDFPYYGAVDTTPMWIELLGAYCRLCGPGILDQTLTNRNWEEITVRDSLTAATQWLVRRLEDAQGDGYLWVGRVSPSGILNQVWEDSPDSYHHDDGTVYPLASTYAPVAVQGYAYDALLTAAHVFQHQWTGRPPLDPELLRQRAQQLRARVLKHFWQPDLGTFAQALEFRSDGSTRAARVVSSSPGHLLVSRLLDGEDAAEQRTTLMWRLTQPDLLAGAGIRTKSTCSPRFNSGSYHNGSAWPMDTGLIADGLRRHGQTEEADDLETRILRGCAMVGGFPEFFRGDPDGEIRVNACTVDVEEGGWVNRLEQPPQVNQGWTATRVWRILHRRGSLAT